MFGYSHFFMRAAGYLMVGFAGLMTFFFVGLHSVLEESKVQGSALALISDSFLATFAFVGMISFTPLFLNLLHKLFFPPKPKKIKAHTLKIKDADDEDSFSDPTTAAMGQKGKTLRVKKHKSS